MSPKERVLATYAHQKSDRVPTDYDANPEIDAKLKAHFGLGPNDDEGLRRALGTDFRLVLPGYKGPKRHPDYADRHVDEWGIRRRWVEHGAGGYWDYCDWPLANATLEEIEAWPLPSADDFDYSSIAAVASDLRQYCIVTGHGGVGDTINSTGMLRTMEQVLVDLVTDEPAGLRLIDRKTDVMLEMVARTLEAGKGLIDVLCIGEDLGTQIGPMISLPLFRKHIRPRLQKFVDVSRSFHVPVMIHSCGSSSWAFDDFIEMGISIVDTLQPEAANMAPAYLKGRFGDRLAFHGGISTAGPVAYGTAQDVVNSIRQTLDVMMPGGGYALAPTHALQSNTPVENVLAMYETARRYGVYA